MVTSKAVQEFLDEVRHLPVLDVRSPGEFQAGHLPRAINVPLFDDPERAEIGTLYRKRGRRESVLRALEITGPKMRQLAESAAGIAVNERLGLHCWRGGMRSSAVAWLLEQIDLQPVLLEGGYKAYRRHVRQALTRPLNLVVLSGLTGAGKTHQIQLLKQHGEQVIDLEALANHRGSAFGGIGLGPQPTVEQFENDLFEAMSGLDGQQRIWVEDESRSIGSVRMPDCFFEQIRAAPAVFMDVSREVRSEMIAREYGRLPEAELIASIHKITRRMGGQNVKAAVQAIAANDLGRAIGILLDYYDKIYLANKAKMDRDIFLDLTVDAPWSSMITERLMELANSQALKLTASR